MTQEQKQEMEQIKNNPDPAAEYPHERTVTVFMTPFAKERPRFAGMLPNGAPHMITPKSTHDNEAIVRDAWIKVYGERPLYERGRALKIQICFYFPPRKILTADEFELLKHGRLPHTTKPDTDNLVKLVLDALNGTAWVDDSAITEVRAWKFYTLKEPRVVIKVSEV